MKANAALAVLLFPAYMPADRSSGSSAPHPDAPASDTPSAQASATASSDPSSNGKASSGAQGRTASRADTGENGRTDPAAQSPDAGRHESLDQHSVFAEIDLSAIRHNIRTLAHRAAPSDLMAIVKADAYGHGATRIAPVLEDEGVRAFAVARPAEGIELRDAGIRGRILVLGAPLPGDPQACMAHNLDVTVSSEDVARRVIEHATDTDDAIRVHLKVDTGMSRLGVSPDAAASVYQQLSGTANIDVEGVWTHFANADAPGQTLTSTQRQRFTALLRDLGDVPYHLENTGALMTGEGVNHARTTDGDFSDDIGRPPRYVRTGIAVYGLAPSRAMGNDPNLRLGLAPALTLKARVTHIQTVQPGTSVSYGATWTATRPTRIATLGAGYGDGFPRLGSGRATVRIGGQQRPVVGNICMDMCMVDLGAPTGECARRVEVGDAAILFGPRGPTMYDVADWANTIPYEICCGLSQRVPRIYRDA